MFSETVCEWVSRGGGHSPCEAGHLSHLTLSLGGTVSGIGLRLALGWASCPVLPSSLDVLSGDVTWRRDMGATSPRKLSIGEKQSQPAVSSSWLMS